MGCASNRKETLVVTAPGSPFATERGVPKTSFGFRREKPCNKRQGICSKTEGVTSNPIGVFNQLLSRRLCYPQLGRVLRFFNVDSFGVFTALYPISTWLDLD